MDLAALHTGEIHWFSDWPHSVVPKSGAAVYTIWDRSGRFLYGGMAGGGKGPNDKGPFGRLDSHANGRRSGNQFCIYVQDRVILRRVINRIPDITERKLSLDDLVKEYIRTELGFRLLVCQSRAEASQIERQIKDGCLPCGKPEFNPGGTDMVSPTSSPGEAGKQKPTPRPVTRR